MSFKLAFIGGGSVLWVPRLGTDLFLTSTLSGSELCLVDIDPVSVQVVKAYLDKVNACLGSKWKIKIMNEDHALSDADCVLVSISTGGFGAMHNDYTIPEKYGVFHSVGDTVGPAGISRTLRNVPVFVDIARKMERLCPRAWMVHVTNPLTQITRAVTKATSVKCAGLCHEYTAVMQMLKGLLKAENDEAIDSICAGVNHFTVLKEITCRGIYDISSCLTVKKYLEYELKKDGRICTGTTDDQLEELIASHEKIYRYHVNFFLYEQLGFLPAAGGGHVCENFPFFNQNPATMQKFGIIRKGVLPKRPDAKASRTRDVMDMASGRRPLESIESRSHEMLALAVESLLAGVPHRIIAALPNIGQVSNLPTEAVVETWAMASRSGIHPVASGEVPATFHGLLQEIVIEQELAVEAALAGSVKKAIQAVFLSPMFQRKDEAESLLLELLEANKDYLPNFKF